MSNLKLLRYPEPALRKQAEKVSQFDENLKSTLKSLFEVLYKAHGWGLAAPQVGLASQIVVMDISPDQNQPMHYINPTILSSEGEVESEEDDLSFPGAYVTIKRARKIELQYQDIEGNTHVETLEGLLACCLQHLVDSINAKLFIDHLSTLKRTRFLDKYKKMKFNVGHHHHHHDHENGHVHGPNCNHDH